MLSIGAFIESMSSTPNTFELESRVVTGTPQTQETTEEREARRDKEMLWLQDSINILNIQLRHLLHDVLNSTFSVSNFVEHMVGVQSHDASGEFWTSKVPITAKILRNKMILVKGSYHKVRKRKMKKDHRSQSLHLAFRVRSPRNKLYLGEDRFNSMAVNLAKEKQHTGSRRDRFKQQFHQFQKRRERDRYRVVIASFRSKNNKWVVAKKVEKNSPHTFSFPPLNQSSVSVGDVLSHADTNFTSDEQSFECSLAKEMSIQKGAGTCATSAKEISKVIVNASKIHGTVEKQIAGLCMSSRVFMNENKKEELLQKNYEIVNPEIIVIAKVVGDLPLKHMCHGEKVQALAIQDGTLHFLSGLDNHVWEPGGVTTELEKWILLEKLYQIKGRIRFKEVSGFDQEAWIGTERAGYDKQKLIMLLVNRSLMMQKFSRVMKLLVGWNQKLLIAYHGLEIKELSWFKELYAKGSLLEVLSVEIVRCKAYVVEWLVVGQKMQTSHDFFPNCCSAGNQTSVSKLLGELFSEFLASRVWEPGGFLLLVNRVHGEWFDKCYNSDPYVKLMRKQDRKDWIIFGVKDEDLKQSTTKVKMRRELQDDFGTFLHYYLNFQVKERLRLKEFSDVSLVNRVWKPGEKLTKQVLLGWLVVFHGCDRTVDDVECLAFRICTDMKRPVDSRIASRVWERGGLNVRQVLCNKLGDEKLLMMFANKGLEIIQVHRVLKLRLHIPQKKLLVMIQKLFVLTIAFIHLEDKVSLSGGSKGMVKELGNDTLKKKLRSFSEVVLIISLRITYLEECCLKHNEVKRDAQMLSLGNGWTIGIITGDTRPFDPGGADWVYEIGRVLKPIEKFHGTDWMVETFSSMWHERQQRPQYIKINGTRVEKEKRTQNMKLRINEGDAIKKKFQSFIHGLGKRFKVLKSMLVNRIVTMKEPRTYLFANHLAEFLTNGVFHLLRPPEVREGVSLLWYLIKLLMHNGNSEKEREKRVECGLAMSLQLEDKLALRGESIDRITIGPSGLRTGLIV